MFTGQLAGRVGLAGQQRTQAGVDADDILPGELVGEQGVGVVEQVVDVGLAGGRVGQVEVPVGVGGADDPVASPGDDEQQALLGTGDQAGGSVDPVTGDDEVHAFGGADLELAAAADHPLDLVDPDAGGVDDLLGTDGQLCAALQVTGV